MMSFPVITFCCDIVLAALAQAINGSLVYQVAQPE